MKHGKAREVRWKEVVEVSRGKRRVLFREQELEEKRRGW